VLHLLHVMTNCPTFYLEYTDMQNVIDDFIKMNLSGLVLELCEKYYDENVLMISNGDVFAESMQEAYDKQKGFIESVTAFNVTLLSKEISDEVVELTFQYRMTTGDSTETRFTGKHIQTWLNKKITKEEYVTLK